MKQKGTKILARIAVMTVVIILCSWISVPYVVPFTLQTFAIFLAFELLGGGWGTVSVAVYVALALLGVPVLSGFKGGVGALAGATGGYVFGFILSGLIYWAFTLKERGYIMRAVACVVGLLACYAVGTLWFWLVYSRDTSVEGLVSALMTCVVPYIAIDLVKIALAIFLGDRLKKIIDKR